jgi:hypothetical protein
MKKLCLILFLSTVASAWAGDPQTRTLSQTSNNKPSPARESVQTNDVPQSATQIELLARETPLQVAGPAPNEIVHGRTEVDGILVQAVKTDNPLQLINPAAPERYGSAEENILRNPASGRVSGLKFLEIRF